MSRAFSYATVAQRVVFGAGELGHLAGLVDPLGCRRALLVTSGSYRRNGAVARVTDMLGGRVAAVFEGVQPHVPEAVVDAALSTAERADADSVIALGGGSAMGTAKAVAMALGGQTAGHGAATYDDGILPIIAIPTTYAGSEMTATYGVTRAASGKVTMTDPRATPRLVVYDPELTYDLPAELTAATGINALAHCVEGVYSIARDPLSTAAALAGIERIIGALPRCVADGGDADARAAMLVGAYLAGTTLAHAGIGLHHGICHVLGGSAGVPHGVANSIMLAHVMRFNLSVCAPELAAVARVAGAKTADVEDEAAAAAGIARIDGFIAGLGLPRRLRDVGVAANDLPRLAALAMRSGAVRANPRTVTDATEVETLLRDAW